MGNTNGALSFQINTEERKGEGEGVRELKEICESKKGTFKATLKANEKYVFSISGLMVKDGFVKVNWETK